MNRIKKTIQILNLLLAAIVTLAACQPDAAMDTEQGTITVNEIAVQVQQLSSMGDTGTRTASPATRTLDTTTGMDGVVKTQFVKEDVIHIMVALTAPTLPDANIEDFVRYYTATCTGVNATGVTTWELNSPMVLPQDATTTAQMIAFYNGVNESYKTVTACAEAFGVMMNAETDEVTELSTYKDVLLAEGGNDEGKWFDIGIALTPDGKLALTMEHQHALLSITDIKNNLGGTVESVKANLVKSDGATVATVLLSKSTTTTYEAIARSYYLQSFTVALKEGGSTREVIVPLPDIDYDGNPMTPGHPSVGCGTALNEAKSYTYRLSLSPGSLTAIPTDGSIGEAPGWGDIITPGVPTGYTPIYNRTDLEAVKTNLAGKYILMADIDLTPGTPLTPADPGKPTAMNKNWTRIGGGSSASTAFTGIFNGNGHTITGMTINLSGDGYQGLFGAINGTAILYNIHMRDVNVTGKDYTAALVGFADGGTISGCSSTGKVSGNDNVGGLVGKNSGAHIIRCWSSAAVTGRRNYIGGLVGYNHYGTIVACYTQDSSVSGSYIGCLVGYNDGTIFGCYAAQAAVSGVRSVGALVGHNSRTVTSCYATNAASSSNKLVAHNDSYGTSKACISPLAGDAGNEQSGITKAGEYAPLTQKKDRHQNARTVVVTDGAIDVGTDGKPAERPWYATGIWGTSPTDIAPNIIWTYTGGTVAP